MNFEELTARIRASIPNPRYTVTWYTPGEYSDASYAVVPLPDGRFTLYRPSGRGEYHEDFDSTGRPRIFENEDAVCDFVWAKLTEPTPTPSASQASVRTPEEKAARLADQRRRFYANRGETDPGEETPPVPGTAG